VTRILVLRFRALGDVLLATPLLAALRRQYPAARIDYLVDAELAPLLAGSPDIDRLLAYPRRARPRWLSDLRWAWRLRGERYDLVLDLQGSSTSVLFTALSGAPRRHGYRVRHRHGFYTVKADRGWPRERGRPYAPINHFRLVESLGMAPGDLSLRLPPAPAGEINPLPLGPGPCLLVAPGATWPAKQWPAAHYSALAREWRAAGWRVALLGSPREQSLLAAIAAASGAEVLAGTDVAGLVAALRHADLLLSSDSGARHVAVALGTPSLALFGPSDPAIWSVADPAQPFLRRELPCSPCGLTRCPLPGHPCMNDLTPPEVSARLRQLYAERVSR
jgi:ADP-heptose:LPS heptosyltransferase